METPGTSLPLAVSSSFRMIDVGEKSVTRRRAVATGYVRMAAATLRRIAEKQMPKGDVLALAEVAGIMAAKNTAVILPLCHPLGIDSIRVWFSIESEFIRASCEVISHGKTGVEMEALLGASAALMGIYDLTKGVDPALSVHDIHLQIKEGGRSGVWMHPNFKSVDVPTESSPKKLAALDVKAAVLTLSDRCARGEAEDKSGPLLAGYLTERGADFIGLRVIEDNKTPIQKEVLELVENQGVELILTTGGTGLGPRDVTPEAVREIATKSIPGIGELLREQGAGHTRNSWLSRSEAFLVGSCLVVLFPGSPRAVKQGLGSIGDLLPHAMLMVRGGKHEAVGEEKK